MKDRDEVCRAAVQELYEKGLHSLAKVCAEALGVLEEEQKKPTLREAVRAHLVLFDGRKDPLKRGDFLTKFRESFESVRTAAAVPEDVRAVNLLGDYLDLYDKRRTMSGPDYSARFFSLRDQMRRLLGRPSCAHTRPVYSTRCSKCGALVF